MKNRLKELRAAKEWSQGAIAHDRMFLSVTSGTGLMMIFFAKELIEDERVQQLKMKAMFTAMSSGIGVTLIAYNTAFMVLRGPSVGRSEMSAYEFLAGVLLIALALFHYWRWQDGRADKAG